MKLSISVLLLLSVMALATPSEAGWVRNAVQKIKDTAKKVSEVNWMKKVRKFGDTTKKVMEKVSAMKGVVDIVKKFAPKMLRGKRSVGGDCGSQADPQARSLMAELELQCPLLFGKGRPQGLTSNDLLSAFQATDGNKDKELNGNELSLFENTLEAVQHCLEILKKPKGN